MARFWARPPWGPFSTVYKPETLFVGVLSAKMLAPDQFLDGYRLLRFLGRGGFGEVWLCQSQSMGDYRALKFITSTNPALLEKEHQALVQYRKAASQLRSPHLTLIEHVNRSTAGLYYVMPLADGVGEEDPADPSWKPQTLSAKVQAQTQAEQWFSAEEVITLIKPLLSALQTLSDAGLVHRDVKPDNILFFGGLPCLGDISLLGEDGDLITRRGTPGYVAPSWYQGGHPDMYGAAATLYTLLTGHLPDKIGREAFLWPAQTQQNFSPEQKARWRELHAVVRRATEEQPSERYQDFNAMAQALQQGQKQGRVSSKLWIKLAACLGIASLAGAAWFAQASVAVPVKAVTDPNKLPELTTEENADYQALVAITVGSMQRENYPSALAAVEELLLRYPQARIVPGYSLIRVSCLIRLGRREEARTELLKDLHIEPSLLSIDARMGYWRELGDLAAAEANLTKVIERFRVIPFHHAIRAKLRADQANFKGVEEDRVAAMALAPPGSKERPEQAHIVESLWKSLENQYPDYAQYRKGNS